MAAESNPRTSETQSVSSQGGTKDTLPGEKHPKDKHVYIADTLPLHRQIPFILTICSAMYTNQLGLGQTMDIVRVIGDWYGITNSNELSWLVAGYSLTIGTFVLIAGRLGDDFGHKRMFIIGMGWYALWTLVCGLAVYSTQVLFIFACVFQGMGPAVMLPNAIAILGQSAPFGAISGFATGGLFALAWWPWAYWSAAIALACLAVFAVYTTSKPRTIIQKIAHLDLSGCITGVASLVLINFAWNQAAGVSWQEPYVYVCLILGFLFAAAFFWVELHWSKDPILPLAAFNSDIAFVYYAAVFVMELDNVSPLLLAAWYSPVIPSGLTSALAVGKLLGRVSAAWVMVIGMVAYLISVLIICVGMDSSFPAATIIFSDAVPLKYQGIGASVVMTIVNYSISLGLGFAGTVEREVNRGGHTYDDKKRGYRGAFYFEVGLAGLGLMMSLVFLVKDHLRKKAKKAAADDESA
ncbi:MFS general substrate transporter [Aspergillus novofumigatus IBT 16806]|uniref:MFS general substrate transporter n=1 Tax=Aspergillus novofumigatus (strain IBT 16806) TaxID=1392255 RepID=A0A2I1CJE9_ASPN1|nr:MFS general substrate transporter [Aspergillus novofumigatus IBT 16806]PKX97740.1 MFS general substrate transporter [Aspergillus novofumigatus IBT 16806]